MAASLVKLFFVHLIFLSLVLPSNCCSLHFISFYLMLVWAYRTNHVCKVSFRVQGFQIKGVEFQRSWETGKIYIVFCLTDRKLIAREPLIFLSLCAPVEEGNSSTGETHVLVNHFTVFLFMCHGNSASNFSPL